MNPNQTPNEQQNTEPQPNGNQYIPPAPGGYVPPADQQFDPDTDHNNVPADIPQQNVHQPEPVQELPQSNPVAVDQHIQKKKLQARKFIIAAIIFSVLFVVGVIFLALALRSDSDPLNPDLTTNEQLQQDLNTFGLGVINFNSGNSEKFTIESEKVGELRVSYLPLEFNDPRTNEAYVITTEIPDEGEIQYIAGGVCNQDDSISQSGEEENFAVRSQLDDGTLYCLEKNEVTIADTPTP